MSTLREDFLLKKKKVFITKGGKLTFIKSTPFSLLIYFMLLRNLPSKVRIQLEKIQKDFLWENH